MAGKHDEKVDRHHPVHSKREKHVGEVHEEEPPVGQRREQVRFHLCVVYFSLVYLLLLLSTLCRFR